MHHLWHNIKIEIVHHRLTYLGLLVLLVFGLGLRFYNIEDRFGFGWDQARDAQKVAQIIYEGDWHLQGPRTGVGHMHIGPLQYYLLAPFYLLTGGDPVASFYENFFVNLGNMLSLYLVMRMIKSRGAGLFAVFVYAVNRFIFDITQTPWNTTLMIGLAAWLFSTHVRWVTRRDYHMITWFYFLTGAFFHAHFSFIFFIPIGIVTTVLFTRDWRAVKATIIGLGLMLLWMIPNIYAEIIGYNTDAGRYTDFYQTFFVGFHVRFFLHRLPYNLIMFQKLTSITGEYIRYLVPIGYFGCLALWWYRHRVRLQETLKHELQMATIIALWIGIPMFGYSIYGGTLSEYYYAFQIPPLIYMVVVIYEWMYSCCRHRFRFIFVCATIGLLGWYAFANIRYLCFADCTTSLRKQKASIIDRIRSGEIIPWEEGKMDSYLYTWYTNHTSIHAPQTPHTQ